MAIARNVAECINQSVDLIGIKLYAAKQLGPRRFCADEGDLDGYRDHLLPAKWWHVNVQCSSLNSGEMWGGT